MKSAFKMSSILAVFICYFSQSVSASPDLHVTHSAEDITYLQNKAIQLTKGVSSIDLNRQAALAPSSKKHFNITSKHHPVAYVWDDSGKSNDGNSWEWFPQGISGNYDRGPEAPVGGQFLVVSWYAKSDEKHKVDNKHKGARVSFIDMNTLRYRHVLLVQNSSNDNRKGASYDQYDGFAPVLVHAGGIEWMGNYLYVADTNKGIRVFDVSKMFEVAPDPTRSKCGIKDGVAYAFDYRYALPQVAFYRIEGAAPYSSLSAEYAGGNVYLWAGQYLKERKKVPFISQFKLTQEGDGIPTLEPVRISHPKDEDGGPVYCSQGIFKAGPLTWLSISNQPWYENSTARLVTYRDGDDTGKRWRWPFGSEDFYYDASTKQLWSLTEHPDSRYFFSVDPVSYQ